MEEKKTAPPAEPAAKRGAYASILAAAALWGVIGLWNRNLMAGGFTPTDIVVVRNFGGMLLLAAVFAIRDRSVFRVRREHLKYFFGTGVVSVLLFTVCYFSCQRICSLAAASILLYTAPSFVVVLSAVFWHEPVTKKKLLALALTLWHGAGLFLLLGALGTLLPQLPRRRRGRDGRSFSKKSSSVC